jgi:hypothetical protein
VSSVAALYRADCPTITCGPNTLHRAGQCVVCGSRSKQPKVSRRQKPTPVIVVSVAAEYWAKQRRSTPARRSGQGAGIHGAGRS